MSFLLRCLRLHIYFEIRQIQVFLICFREDEMYGSQVVVSVDFRMTSLFGCLLSTYIFCGLLIFHLWLLWLSHFFVLSLSIRCELFVSSGNAILYLLNDDMAPQSWFPSQGVLFLARWGLYYTFILRTTVLLTMHLRITCSLILVWILYFVDYGFIRGMRNDCTS